MPMTSDREMADHVTVRRAESPCCPRPACPCCMACGTMSGVFRRMSNFVFRFNRKSRSADDNPADDKSKDRKGRRNRPKAEEAKNGENEAATPAPAGVTGPDVAETTRVKEVARAGGPAEGATRAEVHVADDTERSPQDGSEAEDIMSEDAKGRKKKRGKKDKGKKKGKDGEGKENNVKDQTKPLHDGKKDGKQSRPAENEHIIAVTAAAAATQVLPAVPPTSADSQGSGEELAMIKENEDLVEDNTSYVSGNRESSKEDEVSRSDTPLLLNDIEVLLKKREKEEEIGSLRSRDSQEQLDAEALLAIQEDAESTNSVESFGASGTDRDGSRSENSGVGVLKRILRRKISKTLLKVDLEQCEPEICVALLKFPSVQTFSALKKKLKSSGKEWMQGFLDNEGLEALLDCIDCLGSRRVTQLSEALLLLECVSCVKCVMNSKLGLESLVQRPDYICRLVKALDTTNVMVKKQVIELLSALCVYSADGHRLALEALETYKSMKKLRYRFSLLVAELKTTELVAYKTTLMAFINCILVSCDDDLQERCRIRNEFIGLNLLDIIHSLRNEDDEDLIIQCDVFDDEKTADDEALSAEMNLDVDVTNHRALFDAVFQKVYNTPAADIFLHILQSLLQIEQDNNVSDYQWSLLELAAQKALHLDAVRLEKIDQGALDKLLAPPDGRRLLRPVDSAEKCMQTEEEVVNSVVSPSTGEQVALSPPLSELSKCAPPPPPPPPPPPFSTGVPPPPPFVGGIPPPPPPPPPPPSMGGVPPPPPPPPPPPGMGGIPPPPPPPPGMGGIPPPPPPPPGMGGVPPPPPPPPPPGMGGVTLPPPPPPGGFPPPPPGSSGVPRPPNLAFGKPALSALSPITTPLPKHKMKTFNWSKLPAQALSNDDNVWKEVLEMGDQITVKYDLIEELFCQKTAQAAKPEEQPKAKAPTEVNLLDTKRSMNANIFLKQFKASNEEVVQMIKEGQQVRIGAERLRGLQKILPEKDEVDMIQAYNGDKDKLGNAEKFYLLLSQLPGYKMRVEGMLLKEDFRVAMDTLKPNVDVIIRAAEGLMDSETLKAFLRFVLHAGNFINAGGYAGNALGFKITSLTKLMDTRANKPRVTLLHHLVEEAQKEAKDVLDFASDLLQPLTEASRLFLDNLTGEWKQLEASVQKLERDVSSSEPEVQSQFEKFIKGATEELADVQEKLEKVKVLTHKLCAHFCENEKAFKLEECLNVFKNFCEKVIQCKKENEQRKLQEERAEKRRKEQEAMKAKSKDDRNESSKAGTRKSRPVARLTIGDKRKDVKAPREDDGCIVDRLLSDIRKGYSLRKTTPPGGRRDALPKGKVLPSPGKVAETTASPEDSSKSEIVNGDMVTGADPSKEATEVSSKTGSDGSTVLTNNESAC